MWFFDHMILKIKPYICTRKNTNGYDAKYNRSIRRDVAFDKRNVGLFAFGLSAGWCAA
jgi:hypothetical protein